MTAWVYGGSGATTPGGDDKDIQFNNNGSFSGSNLLITDGSGSLSASVNISASAFYGDGSNLTGLTASAVNVADGPEFSLQFRRDHPITGEISGSAALIFLTASNTLSGTQAQFTAITASTIVGGSPIVISSSGTTISGNVLICNGTASISNLSGCSPIQVHSPIQMQSGLSFSFNGATNTAKITNNGSNLDINSPSNIILNGTVGVGTSSPAASLHVSSSAENAALFRVDTPGVESLSDALLFVTSSGLVGINTATPTAHGSGDTVLDVNGHISVGRSATGIIVNNTDTNTFIKLGGTASGDEMTFICGAKTLLRLDENGVDSVIMGSAATDVIHASGSLTASVGLLVSASAAVGEDIVVGSGTARTIGVLVDGSDDFFVMGHDSGAVTLSASSGVEFVGGSEGVGSFGSDIKVYATQAGSNTVVSLTNGGAVSGSTKLESGGTLTVAGISTLNGASSGSAAGPGSYLALDGNNRIILTSSAASSGGGGSPGGSNTQVQFNDGGSFGGDSTFTFAKTTNVLSVPTITASVGVEAVGLRVSASNPIGEDIFVGSGTGRTIGTLIDGSDDFFVMGNDAGAVTLSASNGVEFVGGSDGVGSFGSDIKVYATQAGSTTRVSLGKDGIISGSGQLRGASVAVDGIVTTHRVQIDDGSQLGTDSDTDMITLNNGSNVAIASDLELRVGNLTNGRVATVGANSKLADHSNFTFASDILSVPTITASVGVMVTSSANGSIEIGEGIRYTFDSDDRLDIFENEVRFKKTNIIQGISAENTSNFNIRNAQVFLVDTNSSVVTGSLPGVTTGDDIGLTFTIKDSGGNAGTNDVVIAPSGSQKIDGATSAKIATNYGAITVVALSSSVNGYGWGIISAT